MSKVRAESSTGVPDSGLVLVACGRCIHVSGSPSQSCSLCTDACPYGVPDPELDGIISEIDMARCQGCGACAAVCPTGVFELSDGSFRHRLREVTGFAKELHERYPAPDGNGATPFVIACGQEYETSAPGHYGTCITWLGAATLLHIIAVGFTSVHIRVGSFRECGREEAPTFLRRIQGDVQAVNQVLRMVGSEATITFEASSEAMEWPEAPDSLPIDHKVASRDSWVRRVGALNRLLKQRGSDPGAADGFGMPSPRRSVAVDAVRSLIEQHSPPPDSGRPHLPSPSRPGVLSRSGPAVEGNLCNGCGECANVCPTGALRVRYADSPSGTEPRLRLDVRGCVGCGRCVDVCPVENAISLVDRGLGGLWADREIVLSRGPAAFVTAS